MSRFCGEKDSAPILQAARQWLESSLLHGQSIFGFGNIWNTSSIDELITYFVDNLDYGEGNFTVKLEAQLKPVSREAKALCAEMMWAMLLAPSNIKPHKKRVNVEAILSWAGYELPDNDSLLGDAPLSGVGSGGTAYNNLRWKELVYTINLFKTLFSLSESERATLLRDGELFAQWLEQVPDNNNRQFRHMLLFLLFPDSFERVFGSRDREKLLKAFAGLTSKLVKNLNAYQIDQKLAEIRQQQVQSFAMERLDWYVPPLKAMWQSTSKSQSGTEGGSIYDTLVTFLEQAQTNDLRTKDYPRTHAGLDMRVSFGVGNQSHVPWIGFLAEGQEPTKGIYPAYLYYRADNLLILTKSVSTTNPPLDNWDIDEGVQTVDEYFQSTKNKAAIRYGESYVFQVYDLSEELDKEQIEADLAELIDEYLATLGEAPLEVREPEPSYQATKVEVVAEPVTLESLMADVFISNKRLWCQI